MSKDEIMGKAREAAPPLQGLGGTLVGVGQVRKIRPGVSAKQEARAGTGGAAEAEA